MNRSSTAWKAPWRMPAAFGSATVSTPANFEIVASTVGNFFQSVEGTEADTFQQALRVLSNEQREVTETGPFGTSTPKISTSSYGTAINSWHNALVASHKIGAPDVYRFEFRPDPDSGEEIISKSKFVDGAYNTPKLTPMTDTTLKAKGITMLRADTGENCSIYSPDQAIFSINYGTTIDKLLEYVIRNSSYIQDQLVVPDGLTSEQYHAKKLALKDKPLNWFRITPKVRLLGFDEIRNVYSREITYVVTPYKIYNIRSDIGPQGVQLYPIKAYDYLYSGINDDIIKFDIKFEALYFSQNTAYRNSLAGLSPTSVSKDTNFQFDNAPNFRITPKKQADPKAVDANAIMPMMMQPVVQNTRAVATGSTSDPLEVAAADLADSLMTSSQGDMLNLNMTIIGDPDYIKQDDVFYNNPPIISNSAVLGSDPRLLPNNGSLVMDAKGLYALVTFRTPTDINENTGLMDFNSSTKKSMFGGLYHIMMIKNRFAGGMFTQDLELVRVVRQLDFDYTKTANETSDSQPLRDATVTDAVVVPSIVVSTPKKNKTADDAGVVITPLPNPEPINGTPNNQSPQYKALAAIRNSNSSNQ